MYQYLNYLPEYLQTVKDFQALGGAVDPQTDNLLQKAKQAYQNQFVLSADLATVERWEKLFNLAGSGTLSERRKLVAAKIQANSIINGSALLNLIEKQSGVSARLEIAPGQYEFSIYLSALPSEEIPHKAIVGMVNQAKPANMVFHLQYEQGAGGQFFFGAFMQMGKTLEIRQVN
ncbi:putative phage tail protein [Faecalispora anaeroviscerum]|uniref:putative phage tail protein n=1 Tax=Faecalispora anaeroviscerum TaxID=2991836 RepID=UPI0024B8DFE5|nr:putative phage tail protein [Faecalispora anaeroviscerum]